MISFLDLEAMLSQKNTYLSLVAAGQWARRSTNNHKEIPRSVTIKL